MGGGGDRTINVRTKIANYLRQIEVSHKVNVILAGVFRSLLAAAQAKWTAAGQSNQPDRAGANENPETSAVFALRSALPVLRAKSSGKIQQAGQEPLKLRYFGHSGTGFTEKGLADAVQRLKPFFTGKPTVEDPPKIPEKIQWVEPRLVCEVAFAEWTEDEQLRQTTFLGWRDDKTPEEVVLEVH